MVAMKCLLSETSLRFLTNERTFLIQCIPIGAVRVAIMYHKNIVSLLTRPDLVRLVSTK